MRWYLILFYFLFACSSINTTQNKKEKEDLYCNVKSKIITESDSKTNTNQSTQTTFICDDSQPIKQQKKGNY